MNNYCECQNSGFCERHQIKKNTRQFELCNGKADSPDCGAKYFIAWEQGQMGATAPNDPKTVGDDFCADRKRKPRPQKKRGAGDVVKALTDKLGIRQCGGCKKRQAVLNHVFPASYEPVRAAKFEGPVIRNLIYHVYPADEETWRSNVDQIVRRWSLFNGRKIVSISHDDQADALRVSAAFPDDAEFIITPNDPKRGDAASFLTPREKLESVEPNEITFYAHAKGVSRRGDQADASWSWATTMYEMLLDYPKIVRLALQNKTASLGLFMARGDFPSVTGHMHYPGTFFWFRHSQVFQRNWRYMLREFHGVESYLGFMLKEDGFAGLLNLDCEPSRLYRPAFWRDMQSKIDAWKLNQTIQYGAKQKQF